MQFLDAIAGLARKDERVIGVGFARASGLAEEGDGREPLVLGGVDGVEDVGRLPGGAEDDEGVAGLGEGLDPAGEDELKAIVVGDAGDVPDIGAGECGEGLAVGLVATGEFFGEVGGVAGGPAVAADQDLVPTPERGGKEVGGVVEGGQGAASARKASSTRRASRKSSRIRKV